MGFAGRGGIVVSFGARCRASSRIRFGSEHRALIHETVAALVRAGRWAEELEGAIEPYAERVPAAERPRFVAVIAAELRGLHDGNYARYRVGWPEFAAWEQRTRGGAGR